MIVVGRAVTVVATASAVAWLAWANGGYFPSEWGIGIVAAGLLCLGAVVIRDAFGGVLLRTTIGVPFSFAFRARRTIVFDGGQRTVELIYPTVTTEFGPPYDATVSVDTGL